MEKIISSLLNIKEQMEQSLQRFDALQQHFKDLQTSYNKMHQIFRQSLDEFEESFYQLEDRICEIEEEDAVAVEENEAKDEIKTAQFTLSHVPKNPEPFPSFSDLPLITSRPSLRFRNYFFSSSSLSVVSSNNYLTVRREALAIRWEFDPSGIYFQCTNTPNPSPFKDRKGISPNKQLLVFNVNGKITLTLCAQLGISSILSVAISNGDPLIERGLTIIWEFDPGGVDHGLQDFNCFLFSFSCDGERMNSLSFPLHSERTVTHQIYSTTQPVVTSLMLRDSMASTTAIRRPFSPRQPICTISLSSIGLTTQKKKSLYYHLSNPYDISAAEEALSQSSPPGLQDEKLVKWVTASQPDFVSCQKYAEGVASVSMVPSKGTTQQIEFQVRKIQCVHKPRPATVPINLQNLRGKKFFPPFILDVFPLRDIAIYGGGDGEVLRVVFLHSSVEYIDNWEINKMGVDVSKQYFPGVADCFEPNVFDEMLEKSIRSDKVRFLTKPILIICNVFLNIYGKLGMPWNKIVLASTLDELQMGLLNGVGLKSQGCATTTVIGNKAHLIGGVNDEPLLSSGIHIFNQTVGKLVNPIVPGSTPDVCIWFLEVGILFVRKLRQLLGKEVVTGSKVVRDNVDKLAVFGDPFGIGKGKLISMLMKEFPSVLGVSVRHRTWPSKGCGRDGVHYHFTEPNALKERERNDGKDKSAQDYFVSFKAICMGCAGDGVEDGNFDWITDDELEANNSQLQRNRGGHTAPCGQGASMGDDLSQSTNGMVGPGLNQAGRILSFLFSFTCFPLCYVMKWATR